MVAQPAVATPRTPQGTMDVPKRKRGRPCKDARENGKKAFEEEEQRRNQGCSRKGREEWRSAESQNMLRRVPGRVSDQGKDTVRTENKGEGRVDIGKSEKREGERGQKEKDADRNQEREKGGGGNKQKDKEGNENKGKGENRQKEADRNKITRKEEEKRNDTERKQKKGGGGGEGEDTQKYTNKLAQKARNGPVTAGESQGKSGNKEEGRNKSEIANRKPQGRVEKIRSKEEEEESRRNRGSGRGRKGFIEGRSILKDPRRIPKEEEEEDNDDDDDDDDDDFDFSVIERKIFEGTEEFSGGNRKNALNKSLLPENRRRRTTVQEEKEVEERGDKGGGRGGRSRERMREGKKQEEMKEENRVGRGGGKGRRTKEGTEKKEEKKEESKGGGSTGRRTREGREEKPIKFTPPGNLGGNIKKEEKNEEDMRKGVKREERKEKIPTATTENLRGGIKKEEKEEKPKIMSPKTENEGGKVDNARRGRRRESGEGEKLKRLSERERGEREPTPTMQHRGRKRSVNKPEEGTENKRKRRQKDTEESGNKTERMKTENGEQKVNLIPRQMEKNAMKENKMQKGNEQSQTRRNMRKMDEEEEEGRTVGRRSEKDTEDRRRGRSGEEGSRRGGKGKGGIEGRARAIEQRGGGREEGSRTRGRGGGRGGKGATRIKTTTKMPKLSTKTAAAAASDSEQSDWEEVGEMEGVDEVKELLSQVSSSSQGDGGGGGGEGVKIELDAPETLWGMRRRRKRRTEEQLIEDYLRRKVNETIRQVTLNMHKSHLLCLLAHGRHLNTALGNGTVLGAALSTTPGRAAHPKGRLDLRHLQRLVEWFGKKFPRGKDEIESDYWETAVDVILVRRFGTGEKRSAREAVLCFVALCRSLGISARLIIAFQPLSWKPTPGTLIRPTKGECQENAKGEGQNGAKSGNSATGKDDKLAKSSSTSSVPPSTSSCFSSSSSSSPSSSSFPSKQKSKLPNRKMLSSDSETSPVYQRSGGGGGGGRGRGRGRGGGRGRERGRGQGEGKRRKTEDEEEEEYEEEEEEEEDSDFEPEKTKFRKFSTKTKRRRSQEEGGGGGGGEDGKKKRKTESLVEWAEVYVEEEEKWVCVDVGRMKIHCVAEIEARMPSGSAYITAFNPDLTVKDVTRRYVSSWLSAEKKLRPCSDWWKASLRPFEGIKTRRDKEEEEEMEKALHLQPLPKTVAEYKNHPLYALQRHLLKFEAIYPPDISPVGFFKGDPVYPRSSVHNLHSRETWLKEAKSVRVDEEPYKIVKARPKWDRVKCQIIKDRPLEVFGEWQVEDYEPPVASGGKVPRNEYGNVELYKPSMLPRGCVHIPVAGINKIARKLRIDCAPAMVGFDFHSGWTHPVYEGFVVCEEYKDVLMDAWNQEQEEQARRAEEKREKRVYGNWRKLIKGMLVRERVRERYQCSSEEEEEEEEEEEKATKKRKGKEEKREEAGGKRKIKQSDLDALEKNEGEKMKKEDEEGDKGGNQKTQEENNPSSTTPPPPLVTHYVKNLSIDLTSNVVEMAKQSRQRMMKTKNTAKRRGRKKKEAGGGAAAGGAGEGGVKEGKETLGALSDESEESDEEAKKEKIRAILNWGTENKVGGPDLSDDSDGGENSDDRDDSDGDGTQHQPSSPFLGFSSLPGTQKSRLNSRKLKTDARRKSGVGKSDSESDVESDVSTSRSTTPEPDVSVPKGKRRLSSRSVKRKVKNYKEEEEEEGDISLDESDFEDKSYIPEKKKK